MIINQMKKSCLILILVLCVLLTGCGTEAMSYDEASTEMASLLTRISVDNVTDPVLDIYSDDGSESVLLDSIDTFPVVVKGEGDINIEIAAATELSAKAPDDLINVIAERFNDEEFKLGDKSVSVSIRRITSGEVVTYMQADAYHPQVYIPSNPAWGMMLQSSGIGIEKVVDRIAGNTAGVLIEKIHIQNS